jgi:hypothetical protein
MDRHDPTATASTTEAQQPLPFDDEADRPIPFALTARARRTVAPDGLPPLEVVRDRVPTAPRKEPAGAPRRDRDDDGALDDPTDTRPARARALRRAGVAVARIARQLRVDELTVRAWTGDVVSTDEPALDVPDPTDEHDERVAFELARAAAREDALDRLRDDAGFAAGVGLLAAVAEIDPHAVTVVSAHAEVVARVLSWLDEHAEVPVARARVVLRLGPDVAGDLARHRWAAASGLPVDRITTTRWRGAPSPDATDALVRLHDVGLAAAVAGWRDALLRPPVEHDPADVAF